MYTVVSSAPRAGHEAETARETPTPENPVATQTPFTLHPQAEQTVSEKGVARAEVKKPEPQTLMNEQRRSVVVVGAPDSHWLEPQTV